nr:MAG TPA: hypothetical protein [Caudoviricetes sp.]
MEARVKIYLSPANAPAFQVNEVVFLWKLFALSKK